MTKKQGIFWGLLLLGAIVVGSLWYARSTAVTFSLQTLEGKALTERDFLGKVVVVNFWATSCTTCVAEMPDMVALYKRFSDRPFAFVAVAMSYDELAFVKTFTETRQLPFIVAYDKEGGLARAFADAGGVKVTPTTFVLNQKGEVIKRYIGIPDFQGFAALVEKSLGG